MDSNPQSVCTNSRRYINDRGHTGILISILISKFPFIFFWILSCSESPSTSPIPAVPSTLIYRHSYFVYLCPLVRIRSAVDLASFIFAWRSRVTIHAADLILFVTLSRALHRVAVLLKCTRYLRLFGMPVVCQTSDNVSANFLFAGASGRVLQQRILIYGILE